MSTRAIETLTAAILAEAGRERDRILRHADSTAYQIRDQAVTEVLAEKERRMADAEATAAQIEARAHAAARLAQQRIVLGGREAVLDDVLGSVAARLAAVDRIERYDEVALGLLRDAVADLGNIDDLIIHADAVTREHLSASVLNELSNVLGCRLSLGDPLTDRTGVIVESRDGRVTYDNTLQQRFTRLRSALRAEVYAILEGRDL